MKDKLVVMPSKKEQDPFFEVVNYHDKTPLWDREEFILELISEVNKGNVIKVLDESLKHQIFGNDYVDDLVSQTYLFRNKSKYDSLKITGPKSYFKEEELRQLNSLKAKVTKLKVSKNIKKVLVGGAIVSTLFFGGKAIVSTVPAADNFLEDLSYKVSVTYQDKMRSKDFYNYILNDLNKMHLSNQGEFITDYSNIDFEDLEQQEAFIDEVTELKEEKLNNSKVKEILDKNNEDVVIDKYYQLLLSAQELFVNDTEVADYVFNNLTQEERILIHENYSTEQFIKEQLIDEKGLNIKTKGNVR